MQRTAYLCSNFWQFPCERIFLGDVPCRKFEGGPFSFPNRIWKLRDRNWLGKWETVSCVATGAVDCWPQSQPPAAWSSGSWDTPRLRPQDRPCIPDARSFQVRKCSAGGWLPEREAKWSIRTDSSPLRGAVDRQSSQNWPLVGIVLYLETWGRD